MSYQEKRTIATIFSGVIILAAYCIYAFGKVHAGAASLDDLKFWATTMLVYLGIGIAVTIVIQILFHILLSISIAVKEKIHDQQSSDKEIDKKIEVEMVEDERDKLIELKSMRFGFAVAGIGFVGALISLILNYSPAVMLNILFLSFGIGSLFEGVGQLYYYRRGV